MSCRCFLSSTRRCQKPYRILFIIWQIWIILFQIIKAEVGSNLITHAEIRALYTLTLDIIYIVHLCEEVGHPINLPAIVLEDNQPVIDLTKTLSSKVTRSKHFLMLIEFIREQVMEGLIELRKILTESNVADLLTKLIVGKTFTIKAMHLLGERECHLM